MPQVSVTINGRRFRMACENGEEPINSQHRICSARRQRRLLS